MLAKAPVHAPPPPPRAAASASTASGSRDGAGVASATGAGSVAASGAGVASVTGAGFVPKKPPPQKPPPPVLPPALRWAELAFPASLSAGVIALPNHRQPGPPEESPWLWGPLQWTRVTQRYLMLHYSRGRTQALQTIIIERAALAGAQRQSPQEPSQRQRQTQAYRLRGQRQPQAASSLRDPRLDDY